MKTKDYLLHLNHLRKFAGYEVFFNAARSGFKLEIIDQLPKGNILVLSPHPDDDVFGCGGSLKLQHDAGCNIKTVYLFNGEGGGPVNAREEEARKASEILGVSDLDFWRSPDKSSLARQDNIKKMKKIIEEFRPEIIYVPSFLDPHPDHFESTKLLAQALKSTDYNGTIFSYEIWSPIFANRLAKIDEVIEAKQAAIEAHSSQLNDRGYKQAILGLAQYRAGMFNVGKYAEAFFACNSKLYQRLFKLTCGK